MSEFDHLCPACFEDKGRADTCRLCGFDQQTRRSTIFLPYHTLLNGQYLVGRELGAGGFGITYLAFDIALWCPVAIKEFFPRELASRENNHTTLVPISGEAREYYTLGLERFLLEARVMARFNHPNIVRVRTFFSENNTGYIVMDYYEGQSLESMLEQKGGPLSGEEALDIFLPILDGLERVHQRDFLHRDIKPQNIYITTTRTPILLDFGAARYMTGEKSRSLSVVLTPGFAPFEQYQSKGNQGTWTDVYSLCATLYFVLSGRVPPTAPERMEKDELVSLQRLVPVLSSRLCDGVMQGLSLHAGDRPQTVAQLRQLMVETPVVETHLPPGKQKRIFVLTCIAGVYEGNTVQLTETPLMIGRDPKKSNLFIADTEISRYHAQVWVDEKQDGVWVADCKSLNGTFYRQGGAGESEQIWEEIKTRQLLKPGERFRVGEKAAIFEVGSEWEPIESREPEEEAGGTLVRCPVCGKKNRLELDQPAEEVRCRYCHAFLSPVDKKTDELARVDDHESVVVKNNQNSSVVLTIIITIIIMVIIGFIMLSNK